MNKTIPDYIMNRSNIIKMLIFITFFSLLFINIYTPFEYAEWFNTNNRTEQFIYSGIAIIGGVIILILSRFLMHFVHKKAKLTVLQYSGWLIAEMILIAFAYTFFNKYILKDNREFMDILPRALLFVPMLLFIPYLVSYLYLTLKDKDIMIRNLLAGKHYKKLKENELTEEPKDIVHFKDEKGTLRLLVKLSNLFYIESADNYVNIYYLNKSKVSRFILRNSLKNIEESLTEFGLIRCHRSFIVNIEKVKVLRKEKEGLFIDLGQEDIIDIPVSKTYSDKIMELFQITD